jgi:7-cyano-7-deazaguanine synthase in queuosine biosynthesis
MDSVLAFLITKEKFPDTIGLWVDLGQPYSEKEFRVIKRLRKTYGASAIKTIDCPIISEDNGNVPTIKHQVIPGRNLTLASIAANYGDEIYLCALDGEMHDLMPDKNQAFFDKTSEALTQAYGVEKVIKTPFAELSKAELIAEAMLTGISVQDILSTSTCYHPILNRCGECSACLKRWIALTINFISEDYTTHPPRSSFAILYKRNIKRAWDKQNFNHYSEKRILETMRAFGMDDTLPMFPEDI